MIKKISAIALALAAFAGATAQNENMYLIQGSHVVGKYAVDDVDYISFELPEGVSETDIWLTVDDVTKNSVTYTVNTINPTVAYAHNIISKYDIDASSMDYMGAMFDELTKSEQLEVLKMLLQVSAYAGMGTETYTQKDHRNDGTDGAYPWFSVIPGTPYYLCVWELDPTTYKPLDTFVFVPFNTDNPGQSNCDVDFSYKRLNSYGVAMNVSGSDALYVRTAWGKKENMEAFVDVYGLDFLMGAFGETFELGLLMGEGSVLEGIENATWPTNGSGRYALYVRAYDADGDMTEKKYIFEIEEEIKVQGPDIRIFSKDKGKGFVEVNFEVSPSNVDEAYVRIVGFNWLEDRLNMGYKLDEVARGGDALDVTSSINNIGEYTFRADGLEEEWKSILIYAFDKDGHGTTLRMDVWPGEGPDWEIYKPVYNAPARKAPARINIKTHPTIVR